MNKPNMTPFTVELTPQQRSLLEPLIREDAWLSFQNNFEEVHGFWSTVVLDTSLLGEATKMLEMETALRALDDIIEDENTPYWQRRLAYQQLARVLVSIERLLTSRRPIMRRHGHRSSKAPTILLDMYVKALEGRRSRNDIRLRMRRARRQSVVFGGSLFLIFAYSDEIDKKMNALHTGTLE